MPHRGAAPERHSQCGCIHALQTPALQRLVLCGLGRFPHPLSFSFLIRCSSQGGLQGVHSRLLIPPPRARRLKVTVPPSPTPCDGGGWHLGLCGICSSSPGSLGSHSGGV